jgi:hypothetical protein
MSNNLPVRDDYLRKKRNKKFLKYGIFASIILLIFGILIYVARLPKLNISKIELKGGTLVTEEEVESLSKEYLQGEYLWIFPVRNAFIYPKDELAEYLKQSLRRIDTINISRTNFHTLSIEITERKPFAIWCRYLSNEAPKMEDGSVGALEQNCYFMDSNSVVFAPAPDFSGDAYFKYYGLLEDKDPTGEYYIASSSKFAGIVELIESSKKLSLRPQYLIAKDNGEFSLVISGGGQIYFDTKEPLKNVIENLEALLKTSTISTSTSGSLPIDYIDLRFGNKLFYKLK